MFPNFVQQIEGDKQEEQVQEEEQKAKEQEAPKTPRRTIRSFVMSKRFSPVHAPAPAVAAASVPVPVVVVEALAAPVAKQAGCKQS